MNMMKQGKTIQIPISLIGKKSDKSENSGNMNSGKIYNGPILSSYTINEIDLPQQIHDRLYQHQIEGVQWLYNLHHHSIHGGILGEFLLYHLSQIFTKLFTNFRR